MKLRDLTVGILALFLFVVLAVASCIPATPLPTAVPNFEATLAWAQAAHAKCEEDLTYWESEWSKCNARPTQTPWVIVYTPLPPPTATPKPLVSCEDAPLGTTLVVHTRTTVRFWHSPESNNLGQAEAGETGKLIDKSMDADAEWWWRAEGLSTNDFPYGTTGWVKAIYSGCIPPKE